MTWPLFWVDDTGADVIALRRYVDSDTASCTGSSTYHNARVFIGQGESRSTPIDAAEYAGDERWPTHCSCGYEFTDADHWQVWTESIFVRRSTGEHWKMSDLPVGATFDAHWLPENWRNPVDGMGVSVVLPHLCKADLSNPLWRRDARACVWNVDGPASPKDESGKLVPHAWTRSGDPRAEPSTLHVSPSIDAGGCCYHGHVQNGVLTNPI